MAPNSQPPADDEAPRRPARKPFLLRLAPEVLAELRAWANQDLRSLNGQIEFLLRQALQRRRGSRDGTGGDET